MSRSSYSSLLLSKVDGWSQKATVNRERQTESQGQIRAQMLSEVG